MDGFAQGLLAGFSTVDNAMQNRKALGLREAALAQQQKNSDRNFQLAQDEFGYRKETDQKDFDLKKERYAKDDEHWGKDFGLRQAETGARIGMERQRLGMAKEQQDYMIGRQKHLDALEEDKPIAQAALNSYQQGDYGATVNFINQLHDGHPMKQMIKPGYAQSSMNALNGVREILQGHPDDAIKELNKPDMLKNLSVTFGSELSQRIGMKDPKTGKTITDAQIGAILPSPDGKGIVLGLDLTYDDGSKSHKPVTEYGSADPRDTDVLNLPGEKAIDYLMQRSGFASGLQNGLGQLKYMQSDQGLSLREKQKIAGNTASSTARAGGNASEAYESMLGTLGVPGYKEKAQQTQAINTAKTWVNNDPSKLEFAQGALTQMPELFEPGNEKQLEIYFQNYLKTKTDQGKTQSAVVTAEDLRKRRQPQQQSDFLYGSD
ncbi:hypothetical protein G3601_001872 [Salmonella enterica]|uniref:Uncharacterized protein n=3 Tax=Salmonella enterica TaxID=28901 RepID=A0A9Y2Y8Q2_SALEB|nr:hypothetical protein [Salmonella enterica subsp. enterica serovar Java]EAN5727928.1 hypothetical protein [Salmonella enterica]EBQ9442604.1 hypothetical protein [Salmonella enterica subsp. enterica serovar Cerro]EBV8394584.1 hypothetical protein [Salmonella enterica subsp. enterica serovar Virchow]EBZ2009026.1 hypothetical protein [Salmonella enterica subsp. enterica serovar Newport]EDQ0179035.1 hypothetical protein [Salmonella enterica subsp. enterica serovar 4,[5],12:b:-]EDV9615296.1 hypo